MHIRSNTLAVACILLCLSPPIPAQSLSPGERYILLLCSPESNFCPFDITADQTPNDTTAKRPRIADDLSHLTISSHYKTYGEIFAGKVVHIVEVTRKQVDSRRYVVTLAEDGGNNLIRLMGYEGRIPGALPVSVLEKARAEHLGKTYWIEGPRLSRFDSSKKTVVEFIVPKYSPITIQSVSVGWNDSEPIRLNYKTRGGAHGFLDIGLDGPASELLVNDPRLKFKWPRRIWSAIEKEIVLIGMTAQQAVLSWGRPSDVNRTITARGTFEQWVYGDGNYLYLTNGRVTAIQN